MIKKLVLVIVLLILVVIAWIGVSVYDQVGSVEVNPNAESYTVPIEPSFNTDPLTDVNLRIEESLTIKPSEFRALEKDSSGVGNTTESSNVGN